MQKQLICDPTVLSAIVPQNIHKDLVIFIMKLAACVRLSHAAVWSL